MAQRRPAPPDGLPPGYFDIRPNDIVIGIMGVTGVGKSTFINYFSELRRAQIGRSLSSCTNQVELYKCYDPDLGTFYLVDTPGFDDSTKTDTQILMDVTDWLNRAYLADILLSGIIYLHRIIDAKMGGQASKSLRSFKRLCGEDAFRKVVLATTFWDQVEYAIGERRERELKTEWDYWGEMMYRGSKVLRHDQRKHSAKEILKYLIDQRMSNTRATPLAIQREMMVERKALSQTGAGAEMMSQLEKQKQEYERKLRDLRRELEEAITSRDKELQAQIEKLTREAEAKRAQDEADRQKLEADSVAILKLLTEQRDQENAQREKEEEQHEQMKRRLEFELAQMREQQELPPSEKQELLQQIEDEKRKAVLLRWKIQQSRAMCLMM